MHQVVGAELVLEAKEATERGVPALSGDGPFAAEPAHALADLVMLGPLRDLARNGKMPSVESAESRTPYSEGVRSVKGEERSPGDRVGVSLRQAMLEWDVHNTTLYRLETEGKLVSIHVGNRVWYSRAQLVQVLGEPKNRTRPPSLKRLGKSAGVDGRQLSFDELGDAAAAA